ncbi:MAG: hypothetical protein FWG70_06065 [Oscillospiraceae bacterium]|nr:hypothetical protein [Oscillospiraceae bacterium]
MGFWVVDVPVVGRDVHITPQLADVSCFSGAMWTSRPTTTIAPVRAAYMPPLRQRLRLYNNDCACTTTIAPVQQRLRLYGRHICRPYDK